MCGPVFEVSELDTASVGTGDRIFSVWSQDEESSAELVVSWIAADGVWVWRQWDEPYVTPYAPLLDRCPTDL